MSKRYTDEEEEKPKHHQEHDHSSEPERPLGDTVPPTDPPTDDPPR